MMFAGALRGEKQILRRLKNIEPKLQRKIIRQAARNAMRPVHARAKANAPKGKTGQLRRNIRLRAIRPRGGKIGISVRSAEEWYKGGDYYAAFQEFGWHIGRRESWMRSYDSKRRSNVWGGIGSARDQRKWVEGLHYMEDAFDAGGEQAKRQFMREVMAGIQRAAKGGL